MKKEASSQAPIRHVLVTGGAGFIGTNLVASLLREGARVTVLDSLVRRGSKVHLEWLRRLPEAAQLDFVRGDVRNAELVTRLVEPVEEIYHLAAQVAVTSSLQDPRLDFEVNLAGTFNVLEAARQSRRAPFVLFTSTNKVYGMLPASRDAKLRPPQGFDESLMLDFHSPYGCSKGAADQYVRDYARIYGLPAVVFRMSCIYGPHQFGTEDQGWVAHFAMASLDRRDITIYGDGSQVRDLLYVDDLVRAMGLARRNASQVAGQMFNIGGGPGQARSVLQVIAELEQITGHPVAVRHGPWRVGDQGWYVSDIRRFQQATGWQPQVGAGRGIALLHAWLAAHRHGWHAPVTGQAALVGRQR